jgi:beta-glucosidase
MGYRMTFGLIEVNRKTQERKVKESAKYLGKIAQAKGLE